MADDSQHPLAPAHHHPWFRRFAVSLQLKAQQLTTLAFVAGGSMLGADTFGVLIGLWPLYPNMVPVLLVACAVAYGVTGLVDHGVHRAGRAPSGLTYRPRRL